ncbi:MAG: histone H1-like repetitive region-containing protein [Alphaproteobacteria bacterium]|nr:histone H1-like repetitive region-containing protein [Alphaproteobacteria bacterium]
MSKGWDNATLKKLKALTGKGLSTSEIGKRLGMSKNAIVGKLNRLGWNAKASAAGAEKTEKKTVAKKIVEKVAGVKKTVATKAPAKKSVAEKTVAKKKPVTKVVSKKTTAKAPAKKATVAKAPAKKVAPAKAESKVSAKSNAKNLAMHQRIIQHSLEMANLKPNQCRWPIGDPDSEHFHFCGETVFVGKPYCYEHCKQAYQFTPPKKK